MEAFRKIVIMSFFLLLSFGAAAQDVGSVNSDELCDARLREVINGVASSASLNENSAQKLMAACASGDLSKDISIQIMLMIFGKQVIVAMDTTKFIVGLVSEYTGGASVNYDAIEAERLASMFPAFQQVILYMNYVFVGIFFFFILLRIYMILMRLNVTQDKEDFKKSLSQDISSWFFNGALLAPISGVLSGIQLILITGLVLAVMLTKTVATLFYVGNGGFSLLETVQNQAEPEMVENAKQNVVYHLCSIKTKDETVKSIMSLVGVDFSLLKDDPYFQCLNSDSPIENRRGTANQTTTDHYASSDYPTLTTFEVNYDVGLERRIQKCYTDVGQQDKYKDLSEPDDCGDIVLRAPTVKLSDPDSSAVLAQLESAFLDKDYQKALFSQAHLMYEYDCRQDGTTNPVECLEQVIVDDGLVYKTVQNTVTGDLEFVTIPFGLGQTTKRGLIESFEVLTEKVKIHIGSKLQAVSAAFLNEFTGASSTGADLTELLNIDKEITKIKHQIERGVWLSSVAFVSDIGKSIDKEIISNITQYSYSTKLASTFLPDSYYGSLLMAPYAEEIAMDGSTNTEVARGYVTSVLIPTFDIYRSYKQCWENSVFCDQVSVNPFSQIVNLGVKTFDSAVTTGVVAVVVRNFAKATEGFTATGFSRGLASASDIASRASKVQIFNMYISIQFIYMLYGAFLALYIPLVPVYILLSKLVSWVKDLVGVTLGLQLDLATSPIGEHENRMLSVEVRKAFSSLFVLGAHFLFIGIGVMMCFVLFSFYMGLNAVVVGLVLEIFGITSISSLLESMVAALLSDTLILFILYHQSKSAASMIKKIPDALAEQFDVHIDQDETIVQKFETLVKGQFLPEVRRFMGA